MKMFGFELRKAIHDVLPDEQKSQGTVDQVLRELRAVQMEFSNGVTPENCMKSPTVHAIVTAISRRFAVTPVHVYRKTRKDGREYKEKLSDHPVAKLLQYPNSWQSRVDYWQDAASWLARYGRFYAFKSRGSTGPIRELLPMNPASVTPKQDPETWRVEYDWNSSAGTQTYQQKQVHHIRGPSRNGFSGDSPVADVSLSIGLEIAAETFGATFFQNGALPLMIFQYMQGSQGFKDPDGEKTFIAQLQEKFSGSKVHRAMFLPKGIEARDPIKIENDKSQMLETRKYQRTVIAGAWGVPPHLVGDLERATFNNVEQQDGDFTLNVIMPYAQAAEAAMERDLLTDDDVRDGVIIRFNLDSILRADFKSRQEGLQIQRQNGAINADEWREIEGKNPIGGKEGETYFRPSNMVPADEPATSPKANANEANSNSTARDQVSQ